MSVVEKSESYGGVTLLGVPVFDAGVWVLDNWARTELLIRLQEHLPPFLFNPVVVVACVLVGVWLLDRSYKRQEKRRASIPAIVIPGAGDPEEIKTAWIPLLVVSVAALIAVACLAIYYSLKYVGYAPSNALVRPPLFAYSKTKPVSTPERHGQISSITQKGNNNIAQNGNNNQITMNPDVNPNEAVTTYDYNGIRRKMSPGLIQGDDGESEVFKQIGTLFDAKDWNGVLKLATKEKSKAPEWLTPYYATGVADFYLCHKDDALKNFEYFVDKADGSPTYQEKVNIVRGQLSTLQVGMGWPQSCN